MVSPYEIDLGELEIEHNGSLSVDHRLGIGGLQSYTLELGTGLTSWWHSEVELGFDNDPSLGQPTILTQVVSENMFQLTEPGEYFLDIGFYIEYGQSTTHGAYATSNEVTFGPVFGKDIGRTTETLNLFFTRQLGPDQTTQGLDFTYALQSRWNCGRRCRRRSKSMATPARWAARRDFRASNCSPGRWGSGGSTSTTLAWAGQDDEIRSSAGCSAPRRPRRGGPCAGGWRWRFRSERLRPGCQGSPELACYTKRP